MRYFLSIILLAAVFSCQSDHPENELQSISVGFDSTWNSTSPETIRRIRTRIAAMPGRNEYILYCRAWVLSRNGEKAKALKTADSLVMGYPAFIKGIYLRANLRAESKDTEGSIADFNKALKKDPVFFEALMNRGAVHFSNQHPDLALKDFQAANKLKASSSDLSLNLANCWLALGQADSACAWLHRADSLGNPKAPELLTRFCASSPK